MYGAVIGAFNLRLLGIERLLDGVVFGHAGLAIDHLKVHLVTVSARRLFPVLLTQRLAVIRPTHVHSHFAVQVEVINLELGHLTVHLLIYQALEFGVALETTARILIFSFERCDGDVCLRFNADLSLDFIQLDKAVLWRLTSVQFFVAVDLKDVLAKRVVADFVRIGVAHGSQNSAVVV